jgi:Tol biopolymer transport system component
MQVSSIGTTSIPTSTAESGDGTTALTSDLFAYCESQINTIDTEADGYFNNAQNNTTIQNDLGAAQATVETLQAEAEGHGGSINDATNVDQAQTQLKALAAAYPAAASQINDAISTLTTDGKGGTDTTVSTSDCESILNSLSDVGNQLNSDNQMQMISLQSAMSDREQAIELTTNILQVVDQSATKVIANIQS